MALKAYKRTTTTSDSAADFAEQITKDKFASAFLSGRQLDVTATGATTFDVPHGLGYAYQGAIPYGWTANQSIIPMRPEDAAKAGVDITQKVRFIASGACTVRFRVF